MKGLSAGMGSGDLQSKENQKNNFPIDLESSLNVYSSPFKMEKKKSRILQVSSLFSQMLLFFVYYKVLNKYLKCKIRMLILLDFSLVLCLFLSCLYPIPMYTWS